MIDASVRRYESSYGLPGLPFNCLVSRQEHQGAYAIRNRRFKLYHVVNGILWPVIVIVMSGATLMGFVNSRGGSFTLYDICT